MATRVWGASQADWKKFSDLVLEDVRPIACNPNLITLKSHKEGGSEPAGERYLKIPSRKYEGQFVGGFTGWPSYDTTAEDIADWSSDSDMGFGFVGRTLKAIDIDIEDPELAEEVDDFACAYFNADLPYRWRVNSPRRMLVYRLANPESGRKKRTITLRYQGIHHDAAHPPKVEFLFDLSFIAACGRHKSGEMQKWEGLPANLQDIPVLDNGRVADFINAMIDRFGQVDEPPYFTEMRKKQKATIDDSIDTDDPVYQFVVNSQWFKGETNAQGMLCVRCPWENTHSNFMAGGGKPDETVFVPKGLNGIANPGFRCMHETHGKKTLSDFLSEIGYIPPEFDIVDAAKVSTPEAPVEPKFAGVTQAGIPPTSVNLKVALENRAFLGVEFSHDVFTDKLVARNYPYGEWSPFLEVNYQDIIYSLMVKGFREPDDSRLRKVIANVAWNNQHDSAKDRLSTLKWDGVNRLDTFAAKVLKAEDSPYSRALVRYLFTAMVGRIIDPGTKADMVPVLTGPEGARKTTLLSVLPLEEEWYADLSLDAKYEDQVRIIKSKSVVELGELRGYANKTDDTTKSFLSRVVDEYVPKFKEMAVARPRRAIFVGTTNFTKILQGLTGDRRWLPIRVGIAGVIDTEYVERNKDMLWAEAIELYKEHGVMWKEVATLAPEQRKRFTVQSFVGARIKDWMKATGRFEVTVEELLIGCFDGRHTNSRIIEQELLRMGMRETENGFYSFDLC